MGNIKSIPHPAEIPNGKRKQSQQSITEPTILPMVKMHRKRWELSERDIAFLCSQTGKEK
jgi:hypothetical protein